MLLKGDVVAITGAGRGLGRGIAQAVAEAGADMVVGDLRLDDVGETAALVEQAGRNALPLVLDVTNPASIRHGIEQAHTSFGKLDGWVNNAGVITMRPALEIEPEEWNRQFEVNVTGLFEGARQFARYLKEQGRGGAIVNIASNAGKVGYPNMAAYNAGKAAVISVTRSLAMELAPVNINVNAVCPGGVDTPMLRGVAEWIAGRTGENADELHRSMVPPQLGRHVQPIEVGRVVAFLLSPHALIIRGQAINADGGETPY